MSRETVDEDLFTELEESLARTGTNKEQVCIVGSTCLSIRGIRSHGDIDIIHHPEIDNESPGERYQVLGIEDEDLFADDSLVDIVDGWRIIRPEIEYCYKKQRRRPKDKDDVRRLEIHRKNSEEWNYQLESSFCLSQWTILTKNLIRSLRQDGISLTCRRIFRYMFRGGNA